MIGNDLLETGAVWFTGCTHFDHQAIIKLAERPFESVDEMNHQMVINWNDRISPNDTVFHLGDFAWSRHQEHRKVLNGNIFHIKGNHDHGLKYPMFDYLELFFGDDRLALFHYPIEEWNGWWRGAIHLHCHTHNHKKVTGERRFNVTVEANDYSPVNLEEILETFK
jgi:calcineurin-like phosphoesterase family protein